MLRGDIPHCGVENAVDHDHYRLHVYYDPVGIRAEDKIGKDTTIAYSSGYKYPGGYVYDFASGSWIQPCPSDNYSSTSDDEEMLNNEEDKGITPV